MRGFCKEEMPLDYGLLAPVVFLLHRIDGMSR